MKVIKNTMPRAHFVDELLLKPGANALTLEQAAAWEHAKKTIPLVQHHLKVGDLVEEGFEADAPAELPLDEALRLASETMDLDQLDQMKATETRPQVLAVIAAQIEALGPNAEQRQKMKDQAEKDRKAKSEADAQRKKAGK